MAYALLGLALFCCETKAQPPAWTIKPQVCITQSPQQSCELHVDLNTQNLPFGAYCLYMDQILVKCFTSQQDSHRITLRYQQQTLLSLNNSDGESVLQQVLRVKSRKQEGKRKRIRQPWSLF